MLLSVRKTLKSLKSNGFNAFFVSNTLKAKKMALQIIPHGLTIGVGDSLTVESCEILEALVSRGNHVIYHKYAEKKEAQECLIEKANDCSVYLTGVNAISEEGHLTYMDAGGNRVSAIAYGPRIVIIICGVNKIVRDTEGGRKRIREVAAPANAKRLMLSTPCVVSGKCCDCNSPDRICNVFMTIYKCQPDREISVIIVGEKLGL